MAALLTLREISKRYGRVEAVSGASVEFEPGLIHAIVGENGAGKSTLLKMAAGVVVPDRGQVIVGGEVLTPHSAREAMARGVGLVEQHFALAGALTGLENVMLGDEPVRRFGRLDLAAARSSVDRAARWIGAALDWNAPVDRLSVGDRQRVAIVRVLRREARVVLLDEPTAVLTRPEAETLYATLRRLAEDGRAVVVVTHRLDEVREHADLVTVMRHGRLHATRRVRGAAPDEARRVTEEAMGDSTAQTLERRARVPGPVRLSLKDVRSDDGLRGVTFRVHGAEIVGIAGVEGNGQTELVRVLSGLEAPAAGVLERGSVATLHEDRQRDGLVHGASVRDNLTLGELGSFARRFGVVDSRALETEAARRLEQAAIDPPDLDAPAETLSGGNQQKIVFARAMARAESASTLVLAQPTRGMDFATARAVHARIVDAAEHGKAVLVVSADLAELRALCDRVLVMARGRIVADLPSGASDLRFGQAMLGGDGGDPEDRTPA
jgi:simple sugar transport system ATP-binding protein